MCGGGTQSGAEVNGFDRRPGFLEATALLPGESLSAVGRACTGAEGERRWHVALIRSGGVVVAELDAGDAIALSIELCAAAGVLAEHELGLDWQRGRDGQEDGA